MRPSITVGVLGLTGVTAELAGIARLISDSHALVGHLWVMFGITWIWLALVLAHLERRR